MLRFVSADNLGGTCDCFVSADNLGGTCSDFLGLTTLEVRVVKSRIAL